MIMIKQLKACNLNTCLAKIAQPIQCRLIRIIYYT